MGGLTIQVEEFLDFMKQAFASVRQPGQRNVWGHPDSNRKHVQPAPHLAPEFETWQQDTARQLRSNEQRLTQLDRDMIDEIVQDEAFLERLSNVERIIQP